MSEHRAIAFGVIGLGRFGYALAEKLAENGKEVLALDINESKIKQIQEKVQQAYVVTQLDKTTLRDAGIQNCDTVIVSIGEQMETNILTTLNVIELGVPRVIAKASSAEHGRVLKKIGAEVVYPERERAVRLADSLSGLGAVDFLDLSSEYVIAEIRLSDKYQGKTIKELDVRRKYNLNIIAIIRGNDTIIEITPDMSLSANDFIVVLGKRDNIARLERFVCPGGYKYA